LQSPQRPRMPDGAFFSILLGFSSVTTAGARQTVWYSSQNWMPFVEQPAGRNAHFVKCRQVKQIPPFFLAMASSTIGDDAEVDGKYCANIQNGKNGKCNKSKLLHF